MKIIVFGEQDAFCCCLFSRLKKERHEIYSVCRQKPAVKNLDVFQQYAFPFDSESILHIMNSVKPDLVLFLGAKDSGYAWGCVETTSAALLGELTNVLLAARQTARAKVVFVSTCDVYQNNTEESIDEDTPASPLGAKEQALLQAEAICGFLYNQAGPLQPTVVRLGELYGIFHRKMAQEGLLFQLCESQCTEQACRVDAAAEHHLLHLQDAVDGLYRILSAENPQPVYHLLGAECLNGGKLVALWRAESALPIETVEEAAAGTLPRHSFGQSRMRELGYEPRHTLEEDMPGLQRYTLRERAIRQKKQDVESKKGGFALWRKIRPFGDNIFFFVIVMAIQFLLINTSVPRALDLFLWYTLLIVVVHNLNQGAVAILFSLGGKIALLLYTNTLSAELLDFGFYFWLMQLIAFTLIVAFVKQKYQAHYFAARDENQALKLERHYLKTINDDNVAVKQEYEHRLVSYRNSLASLYQILSTLDQMESQQVIFQAVKIIGEMIESKDISIYIRGQNSPYCRRMAAFGEKAKTMGKTIVLQEEDPVFSALLKQEIYRNHAMDSRYPILAGGTYAEGQLQMIIMVWSLPLEAPSLYNHNVLALLCRMVERALNRAYTFMEMLNSTNYVAGSRVMTEEAFQQMREIYESGAADQMLDFLLLHTKVLKNKKDIYRKLGHLIRETDYAGEAGDGSVYVLLTNTDVQDMDTVKKRLEDGGVPIESIATSANREPALCTE